MPKGEETDNWATFTQTVKPLKGRGNLVFKEIPPRLKVRKALLGELLYELDLHGKTLEEAYRITLQFINLHHKKGTKEITVITGKGSLKKGLIKNEIVFWLETKAFKDKINSFEWINDGGVLKITLKKDKTLCKKKLF